MASTTITALTPVASATGTEVVPADLGPGVTRKLTTQQIADLNNAAIGAAQADATQALADAAAAQGVANNAQADATQALADAATAQADATTAIGDSASALAAASAAVSGLGLHTADTANPHSTTAAQTGAVPAAEKGAASGVATLDANALLPLAQLPQIASGNFLARFSGGPGPAEEATGSQATALLDVFLGSTPGLVPAGGASTTEFLRKDGAWGVPPGTGGGSSGLNYIANNGAEFDLSGWAEYDDGAAEPVDGTGGTSALTWERITVNPLRGVGMFRLSKASPTAAQGSGVSYDFQIDIADINKTLSVSLDVTVDADAAGSFAVYVYCPGFGFCPVSGDHVINNSGTFRLTFSTFNSVSYRLIIHCRSASTASMQFNFDNVYVGPEWLPSLPAMSDWQDAGPMTITATTTNPTKGTVVTDKVWWRRVGDSAEVRFEFYQSAGGGAGSGTYLFELPAGLAVDTAKIALAPATATDGFGKSVVGTCAVGSGVGSPLLDGVVQVHDATHVWFTVQSVSGTIETPVGSALSLANATYRISATLRVPIADWSATTPVQQGSRYLWAQRYGAVATQVTTTPANPGEYRSYRLGVDTTPTDGPSAFAGFRIDSGSGLGVGRINVYEVFVGRNKVIGFQYYAQPGRQLGLLTEYTYLPSFVYTGVLTAYDPTLGVAYIGCSGINAGDRVGVTSDFSTAVQEGYFDILVADDPVAVAQAPAVYVEATSDAGQVVTGITPLEYEDVAYGSAWFDGTTFTAPVDGVYEVSFVFAPDTAIYVIPILYIDGSVVCQGLVGPNATGARSGLSRAVRLSAGQTMQFYSGNGCTRSVDPEINWLTIVRVGDV